MSDRRDDTFINMQLGKFRLQEIIAIGGMARVYLANDVSLNRKVAVKVLDLTQDWVDQTIIERFKREAEAVAHLEHPNIITIYDFDTEEDLYYQAMTYVEGMDLRQELAALRESGALMPQEDGLKIMRQVASALDFAHSRGVIHRDIKPSNVLLRPDRTAILTDFGLVLRNDDATMGTAFGTPRYIAPEQAVASAQAVAQSDVYSLAVIMYEILTGDTPFDGDTPMEIALAHVSDPPDKPTSRNARLPQGVDKVMLRALAKEPNDRYATATEFVEAIEGALNGEEQVVSTAMQEDDTAASSPPSVPVVPSVVKADESPTAATDNGTTTTSSGSGIPAKVIGGAVGVLVIIGVVIALVLGGGGEGDIPSMTVNTENTEVELTFSSDLFVMHNPGDYALIDLGNISFVRGDVGEGGDDFTGNRITGGVLNPGACFVIRLQNTNTDLPPSCQEVVGPALLSDPLLFFWREGTPAISSFDVLWDGQRLVRCDTIPRGGTETCTFNYPLSSESG
ncbi:MAG: protein kinase [Chloroflexota bacterium]